MKELTIINSMLQIPGPNINVIQWQQSVAALENCIHAINNIIRVPVCY